jgi:prophage regulatory protein
MTTSADDYIPESKIDAEILIGRSRWIVLQKRHIAAETEDAMNTRKLIAQSDLPAKGITLGNDLRANLEAENRFPKRVRITPRTYGYVEAEIDAWLEAKIEERDRTLQAAS